MRQLVWSYWGRVYQLEVDAARVVAGFWNSKRRNVSDRVWTWEDFHSAHVQPVGRRTQKQVLCSIAAGMGLVFDTEGA